MASRTTITINHCGLELDVPIYTWPPSHGARDSFNGKMGAGIQLEPDEPGGFELDGEITVLANEDELTIEEIAEVLADHEGIEAAVAAALAVMIEGRDY